MEDSQVKVIPVLQIYMNNLVILVLQIYMNNIDSENLLSNGNELMYLHLGHIGCRLDGTFLEATNSKSIKKIIKCDMTKLDVLGKIAWVR